MGDDVAGMRSISNQYAFAYAIVANKLASQRSFEQEFTLQYSTWQKSAHIILLLPGFPNTSFYT